MSDIFDAWPRRKGRHQRAHDEESRDDAAAAQQRPADAVAIGEMNGRRRVTRFMMSLTLFFILPGEALMRDC